MISLICLGWQVSVVVDRVGISLFLERGHRLLEFTPDHWGSVEVC